MNKPVIVCGTDFSVRAADAVNVARAIAQAWAGRLLLLHVAARFPNGRQESLGADAHESHSAAETPHDPGSMIEASLVYGPPHKALAEAAIQHQARMIVVGAVDRTRRWPAGSVALRTAETATVPTLVVGEGRKLAEWASGKHSLRIVMGDDFSAAGDEALGFVADLAKLGPCEITVAHVAWPSKEGRGLDFHGPVSLTENHAEIQRMLEKKLAERTSAFLGDRRCTLHVVPCRGQPERHLLGLATESRADLFVLGTQPRHGIERLRLGSVWRGVQSNSLANVVVMPMAAEAVEPTTRHERSTVAVEALRPAGSVC